MQLLSHADILERCIEANMDIGDWHIVMDAAGEGMDLYAIKLEMLTADLPANVPKYVRHTFTWSAAALRRAEKLCNRQPPPIPEDVSHIPTQLREVASALAGLDSASRRRE